MITSLALGMPGDLRLHEDGSQRIPTCVLSVVSALDDVVIKQLWTDADMTTSFDYASNKHYSVHRP